MGFYDNHVLPRIVNCACGTSSIMDQRKLIVPQASGTVLEIGIGTGLNLPFYDPIRVERVIGLDPSHTSWKLAADRAAQCEFPIEFVGLPDERIPLDDQTVDTVLVTYSLCTIPDPAAALRGVARLMKPSAQLLFCEHGLAPDSNVVKWQNRLNPLWNRLAGGCFLSRDIPELIVAGGFKIESLESGYLKSLPKFASFNYSGRATSGG